MVRSLDEPRHTLWFTLTVQYMYCTSMLLSLIKFWILLVHSPYLFDWIEQFGTDSWHSNLGWAIRAAFYYLNSAVSHFSERFLCLSVILSNIRNFSIVLAYMFWTLLYSTVFSRILIFITLHWYNIRKIHSGLNPYLMQDGQEVSVSKPTAGSSLKDSLSLSSSRAAENPSASHSRASEEVLSRLERYRVFDLLPVSEDELAIMLSSESPPTAAAASSASGASCVRPRFVHWEPFKPLRSFEDLG